MKLLKIFLFAAMLVAISLPAVAQSRIQFDIPFNFSVAGQSLPAGHYTMQLVSSPDHSAWRISGDHGSVMMLTLGIESLKSKHPFSLVFWRSNDAYTLVRFWPDEYSGRALILTSKVKTTVLARNGEYVEIGAE